MKLNVWVVGGGGRVATYFNVSSRQGFKIYVIAFYLILTSKGYINLSLPVVNTGLIMLLPVFQASPFWNLIGKQTVKV